jgi:hypothetical protein
MRTRVLSGFILSLAIAAGAGLASEPVSAQTPAGPRRSGTIARMPDGRPDLQGTYDVATITQLERPVEFGDRLTLTDKEAATIEEFERQWNERMAAPLAGDRAAPPVGGDTSTPKTFLETLFRFGGGVVGGYNTFWLAGGTQVVTVDGQKRTSIIVDPPNGRIPAMKPEAKQRNSAFLARAANPSANESDTSGPAGAFDNPEQRPLAERCLLGFGSTSGPPTLPNYFYNNLKQIVQTRETIMILIEMVHDARIIRMNATHLPPTVRKWMGDSIGHWEGDTLVVDTTNFTSKTQFQGSTENLHVVERFTPVGNGAINYRFTVEDPSTWDRAWSGEYTWRATSENIYEYACHEANHALSNVLSGARFTERQAAEKKNR